MNHIHMSRPVRTVDAMLPRAPRMDPNPIYGLWVDNLTGNPTWITDPHPFGYAPLENIRYVNLYRETVNSSSKEGFFKKEEASKMFDKSRISI